MSTIYAPEVHVRRPHINLWLVAVVGLAAALVALGTWVLVDRYTGPEHDATTLIDDVAAAWSAGDSLAVTPLYTADAVLVSARGDSYAGPRSITFAVEDAAAAGMQLERIAPVTTEGDFATTFVSYTDEAGGYGTLLTVFQLDEGKVARQWDFELGATPPFDARAITS